MIDAITLDANLISPASDVTERRVIISVAASPFYTPAEANASFDKSGDLSIHFDYKSEVRRPKLEMLPLGEDVRVQFDQKSGRVQNLVIPCSKVPEKDSLHLKIEIEEAYKNAYEELKDISNTVINRGSLNAALVALKEYSADISKQARSTIEVLST